MVEHGYAQTKQLVSKRTKYSSSPHTSSNAYTQPINDVPKAIDPKHVQLGTSKLKCIYTYAISDVSRALDPKHVQLGTPKFKCIYTYTINDVPRTTNPKHVQLGTPKGKSTLGCIKIQ
jgi:hypothetical protein